MLIKKKMTRKKIFTVFCVVLILVFASIACFGGVVSRYNENSRTRAYETLSRSLEDGTIQQGDLIGGTVIPKPTTDLSRRDADGAKYSLFVFDANDVIILMYVKDKIVYAACRIEGVRRSRESWYFCDFDLLSKHISLCIDEANKEHEEEEEEEKRGGGI